MENKKDTSAPLIKALKMHLKAKLFYSLLTSLMIISSAAMLLSCSAINNRTAEPDSTQYNEANNTQGGSLLSGTSNKPSESTAATATEPVVSSSLSSVMSYVQTIEYIESKMKSIMEELSASSTPNDYIKDSNYDDIVNIGVKAVKPLYDMLCESEKAGLYEYIICRAIQDITNLKYIYNAAYGWRNAQEFRLCYETKVNNSITSFESIMNLDDLSDDEKIESITELGVFAVGCLLDEYDKKDSLLSRNVIEKSLVNIMENIPSEKSSFSIQNLSAWRAENEQTYRSLMKLNGKSYKPDQT